MNIRALLRQPVLTIAFHPGEARWTVGSRGAVRASGRIPLPDTAMSDGVVLDPQAVGDILRNDPAFPGAFRMQVALALPAQRTVFRTIEIPQLKGKHFAELAEREVRREMPMASDNAYLSWSRAGERDGKAVLFVVAVARDIMDSHVAAARAAGLHPQAADLRIIAAARAIGDADCVVACVEDAEVEIAIFRDGLPVIVRHVGLNHSHGNDAWLRQLGEELARTLKFYRDTHRDDPVAAGLPITFVGDAAGEAMRSEEVRDLTDRTAVLPPLRLPIDDKDAGGFAANVGLALKDIAA